MGKGIQRSVAGAMGRLRSGNTNWARRLALAGVGVGLLGQGRTLAQGIPEPDLVVYGIVRNVNSNANIRIGYGTLEWTFQPQGGGTPVIATTTLTNINDLFSYILRVPCETPVAGFAALTNRLQLTGAGTTFDRSQVTWNGNALSFAEPSLTNTTVSSTDRGRIERIDLTISVPVVYDINGLPVDWELMYFGQTGIDPFADPDHDGLNTFAEYRAGTNPNDPLSNLRFVEVRTVQNGIRLKWLSALDRNYALQRASSATGQYLDIVTNIPSTPPLNTFIDITATGPGPYFYRLRIDDIYSVPTSSAFRLIGIRRDPLGGISIDWQSASGKTYAVQRSSNVSAGYVDIVTNIAATPPVNSYRDATATGPGPYFYRLRLGAGSLSVPIALKSLKSRAKAQKSLGPAVSAKSPDLEGISNLGGPSIAVP